MNYKRFLELLNNEEVQDKIKDLYCQLQEDSFEDSGFQGWRWLIILSEDGTIDYMYGSQGTSRRDICEETAIIVATIEDNAEVPDECMGDIKNVPDYDNFIEYLKNDFEYEASPDEEDFEEKREEYVEDNCNWMNYYEFNLDGYREVEKEAWVSMCDMYSYDEIVDIIYNKIEELEDRLNYYNQFEQEEF